MKNQFLKMPWGRMAYTEVGTGEPVMIFLHGSGCDNPDWQEVFPLLPDDLHWIAMEFRGHGASDTPAKPFALDDLTDDVILLLDALNLSRAVLVGHSLGGMVAMAAARRDRRVAGLVLLEGWTSIGVVPEAFAGDRYFGALSAAAIRTIEAKSDQTIQRVSAVNWECLRKSLEGFDAYPYLQAAQIPIAEVYGGAGLLPDPERRLRIPPNPHIRTIWIPGCGHYLSLENPKAVATICRQWTKK